ncbi:MAG: hypothetical protein HC905_00570 [Bacteroidales bacterium]|nr:hypothetical protein [Bacteroidales bacterium]
MLQLSNLTVTDADDSYPSGFTLKLYGGTNYTLTGSKVTPKLNYNGTLQVPAKVFDGKDSSNIFQYRLQLPR